MSRGDTLSENRPVSKPPGTSDKALGDVPANPTAAESKTGGRVRKRKTGQKGGASPDAGRPGREATAPLATPTGATKKRSFFGELTLQKCLVFAGFLVAAFLVLVFGADALTGWPFSRARVAFDVAIIVCGLGLAWLSWDAYRDLR
jgi:hypothetical protein